MKYAKMTIWKETHSLIKKLCLLYHRHGRRNSLDKGPETHVSEASLIHMLVEDAADRKAWKKKED